MSHLTGIQMRAGWMGGNRSIRVLRNQVLLSIHHVSKFVLIQKTVEEFAVVGTEQLCAVITLKQKKSIANILQKRKVSELQGESVFLLLT